MPKLLPHQGIADSLQARLIDQGRALEQPRDFWKGRIFPAPLRPQNILVFTRASRKELFLGNASRSLHHRYVLITAVKGDRASWFIPFKPIGMSACGAPRPFAGYLSLSNMNPMNASMSCGMSAP
jgi:hypothetical protein